MRVDLPEKNYTRVSRLWSQKLSKKGIATLLKKSFLFAVCSKSEITLLSNNAILREFVPDQHLYSEGDDGDVLFVIQSGAVQLTKKMPSGDVLVTKILKPLDAAGVNAVMTGQKRERSAVALTHVKAYVIKRDVLKQMLDKYHTRIQHIVDQIIYEEELRNRDFQSYLEKRTLEEEKTHQSIIGQVREFLGISKR
jgi:CRP-like cAMP-binding protein